MSPLDLDPVGVLLGIAAVLAYRRLVRREPPALRWSRRDRRV
jgi:hypothetical protein